MTTINKITNTNKQINIIDSIMGSGKTSWAIQYMNNTFNENQFIYITALLTEVDRIKKLVDNRTMFSPETHLNGRKIDHLKMLLNQGKDIVLTHSLFLQFDDEVRKLINDQEYTLIIDETMNLIQIEKINKEYAINTTR